MTEKPEEDNIFTTPDGRKLVKVGSPVKPIDPKRYPAHESLRRQGGVTTGQVFILDRLYAEALDMHKRAVTAEARVKELEQGRPDGEDCI